MKESFNWTEQESMRTEQAGKQVANEVRATVVLEPSSPVYSVYIKCRVTQKKLVKDNEL